MTDKPTPKQTQVAAELRRILCNNNDRTVKELAQCQPTYVSGKKVADMCGYPTYAEVPNEFCDAVCAAGYAIGITIACGYHTVVVGSDFESSGAS